MTDERPSPRAVRLLLIVIVLGALVPRLVRLDRLGLWFDEGFSVLMVELANPLIWRADVHPPLYYALLWAWSKVASGDAWLRALSAVFGVAALPVVYALGARLFSRAAGLWAAAFLALLHMHIWYSREARMYALMVLLFSLALLGLTMAVRRERGGWTIYAAATAALTLTQALGIGYALLLAGVFWILAPDPVRSGLWRKWARATALALLPFAIWLPFYLSRVARVASEFWIKLESPWPPLLRTLRVLAVSAIPLPEKVQAGGTIWVLPILGVLAVVALGHRRMGRRALLVLLTLYAAPIIGLTLVSLLVRPVLIPRVLLPVSIPLVLALGALVDAFPPRRLGHHAAALVLAGVLALGGFYGLWWVEGPHEDWRGASRFLQEAVGPTDTLFFSVGRLRRVDSPIARINIGAGVLQLLVRRYDPEGRLSMIPQITIRETAGQCGDDPTECLDRSLGTLASGRVVWLIAAHGSRLPIVREWFDRRLELAATHDFKGVRLERWVMRAR